MVEKSALEAAATEIEEKLRLFGAKQNGVRVHVFESSPGNLRAILASDTFKGIGLSKRQELVWNYLRKSITPDHLRPLMAVHVYDGAEFSKLFPGDASGALSLFISGIQSESN